MTMHLEGPWLSTAGKKKGKIKFASAEAKRKHEQLQAEWEQIKRKHGVKEQAKKPAKHEPLVYNLGAPPGRATHNNIPSLGTVDGNATKPEPKVYTGDKIIGVATLHKSVAVPVFSQEEAIDISRMRR